MKKLIYSIIALLISITVFAQAPQSFNYQAVARDASGEVIANQQVSFQISILQGSESGTAVYVETFMPTTNGFGLINLNIGAGTVVSGDITTIDWSADTYFMKVEMDMTGGTTYEEYGTSRLLSVPYALHAKTAENVTGTVTETDPVFGAHAANGITSTNITNWTTAYGWGNHLAAGYTTTDTTLNETEVDNFVANNGYLTSETDPVYGASQAANITATDITNLGNLSGTNTGDQTITLTGNITGSGTGSFTTTIADKAVTLTKMDDMSTSSLIYRKTAGTGTPEIQTLATLKTDLGLTGTNSGDQTSIVGITGTLAEFNTALTGVEFATGGGTATGTNTGDQDLSNLALKSNVLELDNTTAFTPDADYEPATKKYVDDAGATTYSVGDFALGGIVFWVDETGQHGLVCAKEDQDGGSGVRWHAGSYGDTRAYGDHINAGKMNTDVIVGSYIAIIGDDGSPYASEICKDLTLDGYSDWYLPSKEELNLMYENKATIDATAIANGGSGFASLGYWSSTEYNIFIAWKQNFNFGNQDNPNKNNAFYVRAIRAF